MKIHARAPVQHGQDGLSLVLLESVLLELGMAQEATRPSTEEETEAKEERTSKNHTVKGMSGFRTQVLYYHPGPCWWATGVSLCGQESHPFFSAVREPCTGSGRLVPPHRSIDQHQ